MNTLINHFDRGKPFYPLVISYIIQLLGFKELAVRGLIGKRIVTRKDILNADSNYVSDFVSERVNESYIEKLLGPLELRSEFQDNRIIVYPDEMARDLADNFSYILPFYLRAASSLLILAHEMTKDQSYRDNGPLWEFLRHCRNAATHNGLFHFIREEPRRPAVWGSFIIEIGLQGTPLFKDANGDGMLSYGDPIRLLWDIEQAYPDMIA